MATKIHMTVGQFADIMGVSPSTVRDWIAAWKTPQRAIAPETKRNTVNHVVCPESGNHPRFLASRPNENKTWTITLNVSGR